MLDTGLRGNTLGGPATFWWRRSMPACLVLRATSSEWSERRSGSPERKDLSYANEAGGGLIAAAALSRWVGAARLSIH